MKHLSLVLVAQLVVVHGLPHGEAPLSYPTARQHPFDDSFDELAADALEKFQIPAFSVSVVDGNSTYAKGYGIARFPSTNATGDTLYFAGSTTKSFTAASILKLIEANSENPHQLSLQSRIIDIVPWKLQDEYVTNHATLEDALSHRTGLPRHDMSYGGPNFTVQDLIDSLPHLPLTKEIRQQFQYCNIMFIILSQVIEKLSDTTLGNFFKTNIWQPLGMTNTYLDLDEAEATGQLAGGYWFNNDTKEYVAYDYIDPEFVSGAGGAVSSVLDYAKYLRAMLQKNPAILTEASYNELRVGRTVTASLPVDLDQGPAAYTLGWFAGVYEGYELIQHTGGVPGFATIMMYMPDLDWAATVMCNADQGGAIATFQISLELLDRRIGKTTRPDVHGIWQNMTGTRLEIMKNLRAVVFPDAPPPDQAVHHALPLEAYTGSYYNPGYRHLNLTLSPPPTYVGVPVPSENGSILHANVADKTWPHVLDFEHISAEHFLVRTHYLKEAANFDLETEAMRAEFQIGSDSRVAKVGLGYEPLMDEELIWFDKE